MSSRRQRERYAFSPDLAAGRGGLPQLWGYQGFWQIRLRWAVAPLMIAAVVVGRLLGFELRVTPVLVIAMASPAYNVLFALVFSRYRRRLESDPKLDRIFTTAEVVVDYLVMFLLLYFTGGASSPLAVFLIFHVIIAAIQFPAATAYALAGVAAGGLWLLLLGQVVGGLDRHHIAYRGQPLHFLEYPAFAVIVLAVYTATFFITAGLVSRIMNRLRDRVGDLADATSDLARAHECLRVLNRERTEFMLEVAHNLRAPIGASLGIVDLLTEGYLGDLEDRQTEHLGRLERRLRALDKTIGELLAIARTRDRTREIEDVTVDLAALARRTEEMFQSEAGGKGVRLVMSLGDDLPPVESGVGLLEQLLENLVSNAIKYTPEGGEVEVRFERLDGDSVRIEVEDTGIGIPVDEQEKLFREFFRASNARELTPVGTGLGLVLVKQTVDRHDGTLELESEEGRGTRVTVTLPSR